MEVTYLLGCKSSTGMDGGIMAIPFIAGFQVAQFWYGMNVLSVTQPSRLFLSETCKYDTVLEVCAVESPRLAIVQLLPPLPSG